MPDRLNCPVCGAYKKSTIRMYDKVDSKQYKQIEAYYEPSGYYGEAGWVVINVFCMNCKILFYEQY